MSIRVAFGDGGEKKLRAPVRGICLVLLSFCLVVQLYLLVRYSADQSYLRILMDGIAPPSLPPSEQAIRVTEYFHDKPVVDNKDYILVPVFRFLRPTPRQVAERGGWCAERSRLAVALLQLHGIRAAKWALYTARGTPRHAVVEVETEQGKMAIDPLFGLWFPKPGHGYYSVEELRINPQLVAERIAQLRAANQHPGSVELREYPLNRYTYAFARSINWNKSPVFSGLYLVLFKIFGPEVNDLPRPAWTEQPALMLLFGVTMAEALLLLLLGAIRMRKGGKLAAERGRSSGSEGVQRKLFRVAF